MHDKDLRTLRDCFCEDHIGGHEFDELNFLPVVYQRIFFMERRTRKQAREHLAWLWDQIRAEGYNAGNRSNMAVIGHPLTKDFRHWEIFADVSQEIATVAVEQSAALFQRNDGLNCAITAHQRDPSSYVLPNIMLVDEGRFDDRFTLFMSRSEILSCGARNRNYKRSKDHEKLKAEYFRNHSRDN